MSNKPQPGPGDRATFGRPDEEQDTVLLDDSRATARPAAPDTSDHDASTLKPPADVASQETDVPAAPGAPPPTDIPAPRNVTERPLPRITSRPPVDFPVVGRFAGFDIMGRLALGGMAEILLARHRDSQGGERYIVVKKILPHFQSDQEFVQMFLDEARLGMMLEHDHICKFYQFGEEDGAHFMTMEWVHGMPLGRLIRQARKHAGISIPTAVRIISNIADALHYAHNITDEHGEAVNLIHRDVSPHNIMLSYHGDTKLLDFGIAKAELQAHRTQAGVVKGKFAYMSPEQCTGGDVDHRLDVFALGVCLFETVTGKSLYRRKSEAATMRAIIMDPVPTLASRLPDVPKELDRIVQKALAKKPEDRYASAHAFHEDLERFMQSTGVNVSKAELASFMRNMFIEEYTAGPRLDSVAMGLPQSESSLNSSPNIVPLVSGTRELEIDMSDDAPRLDRLLGPTEGLQVDPSLLMPEMPGDLDLQLEPAATSEPKPVPGSRAVGPGTGAAKRSAVRRAPPKERAPEPKRMQGLRAKLTKSVVAIGAVGLVVLLGYFTVGAFTGERESIVLKAAPQVLGNRIQLASAPEGASVSINGELSGVTPFEKLNVEPGEYTVSVEAVGFARWQQQMTVSPDAPTRELVRLVPRQGGGEPGATGYVSIQTLPPSVVYIDDEKLGPTPLEKVRLPTGTLSLTFELDDGTRVPKDIVVRNGEVTEKGIRIVDRRRIVSRGSLSLHPW